MIQRGKFFWNSLAFAMIHQILAIWSLVPLPFLKWAKTSGKFLVCIMLNWTELNWSPACKILSLALPACTHQCNCPVLWTNGNPLQYSCLENSMDGGAWWATVHGVTKSRTRLSDFMTFLGNWDEDWHFPVLWWERNDTWVLIDIVYLLLPILSIHHYR